MYFDEYLWIVIIACIGAFFAAYGIGANDVSNAFGSSVGAKSLTLGQAIIIAAIFEFLGTVLIGSQVTDTIRKNIINIEHFKEQPEILMYGMLCVVFSVAFWLFLATYLELPVSTTHSAIGSVVGIGLVYNGIDGVVWADIDDDKDFLSRYIGILPIITSWIISPILSGIVGAFIYWFTRKFILRSQNSVEKSFIYFPIFVVLTIAINIYFIIYKGFKRKINDKKLKEHFVNDGYISLFAWGCGIFFAIIVYFILITKLKNKYYKTINNKNINKNTNINTNKNINKNNIQSYLNIQSNNENEFVDIPLDDDNTISIENNENDETHIKIYNKTSLNEINNKNNDPELKNYINVLKYTGLPYLYNKFNDFWTNKMTIDLHEEIFKEKIIQDVHDNAEKYDENCENTFKYIQIFTAAMGAWGHGANDSANALGPLAAIWTIYKISDVESKADVPFWILILGGIGIVIGLATYGYKIIKVLGFQITKITPSRGYAIELGSSIIIIIGSIYGIPLSTTFCQTGATVGVGLLDGNKSINKKLLFRIFIGWILTLIISAGTSALLFSFGIYSPSIRCDKYNYN